MMSHYETNETLPEQDYLASSTHDDKELHDGDDSIDFHNILARLIEMYATSRQTIDVDNITALLRRQALTLEERYKCSATLVVQLENQANFYDENLYNEQKKIELCLVKQLKTQQEKHDQLINDFDHLLAIENQLNVLRDAYYHQQNAVDADIDREFGRIKSLEAGWNILDAFHEALRQTNVLNDAFSIWYDGPFGTICGLRLGRLPDIHVEWSEIDAAWGQVALALVSLSREAKFSFTKYRIIPQGSICKMAKIGEETTYYDLFVDPESYGGRYFSSFNDAMVCILHCMQELGDYATRTDYVMKLPYSIEGDKIEGLSIRMGGSDEDWTRALKRFLLNLKWLIVWNTKRKNSL